MSSSSCSSTPSASVDYFLDDGTGSVSGITNSAGDLVESYVYDPDGNVLSGTTSQPMLFLAEAQWFYDWDLEDYDTPVGVFEPQIGLIINAVQARNVRVAIRPPEPKEPDFGFTEESGLLTDTPFDVSGGGQRDYSTRTWEVEESMVDWGTFQPNYGIGGTTHRFGTPPPLQR